MDDFDNEAEDQYQKLSSFKIPLKNSSSSGPSQINFNSTKEITNKDTFISPLANEDQTGKNQQQSSRFIKPTATTISLKCDPLSRKRKLDDLSHPKPIFFGRDESYPPELNDLIQPLYCCLCKAALNSIKSARFHYESKSHDKKITNWLTEWSKTNGKPIPNVKRFVLGGPTGPNVLHCDICDLPLTSLLHAEQHYNGRKHKLAASGRKDPSGSGYYNSEGKWIRQLTKPSKDVGTRFGIGNSFLKQEEQNSDDIKESEPIDSTKYCSICKISVTSSQQMEMHLSGTKHEKNLKKLNFGEAPPPRSPSDTLLSALNEKIPKDCYSIYRTPSGNYYCKTCNLTLPDTVKFEEHLSGKKHKKAVQKETVDKN